jgi:pyruvate-ferredoxin/flavodoxin oxidoreductase
MGAAIPARVKRQLAALKPQLYVVDARRVADSVGLGKRINMVMQTVFFSLSGVVPIDKVGWCCVQWGPGGLPCRRLI